MEGLEMRPDEELAALAQGKSEAAFGVLMERYQNKLLRYGRRFLYENAPIEDAVQEVFIKVYQNIQSYDPKRPFSPWIYRIAHNMFVNALRERSRLPFITVDMDLFSALSSHKIDPAEDEEREEIRSRIERGLAKVSALYREVLILYYLEDLSYQEISEVLRVPVGTVGIRLKRAREALKKHVEPN